SCRQRRKSVSHLQQQRTVLQSSLPSFDSSQTGARSFERPFDQRTYPSRRIASATRVPDKSIVEVAELNEKLKLHARRLPELSNAAAESSATLASLQASNLSAEQ